jgi:hypothetical protein
LIEAEASDRLESFAKVQIAEAWHFGIAAPSAADEFLDLATPLGR